MPPRTFSRTPRPDALGASGSALFGQDLDVQLQDQLRRFANADMPYVLMAVGEFLRGRVLATPGLFVRDIAEAELLELKMQVDSAYLGREALDFGTITQSAHAVAAVLKAYVRELPRPLLSFELYPYFLASHDLGWLQDLLSRLPPAYLVSARMVLFMLFDVTQQSRKITSAELAQLFAPLMLRPEPGGEANPEAAVASLDVMIQAARQLLPPEEPRISLEQMSLAVQQPEEVVLPDGKEWFYIDDEKSFVGPVATPALQQLLAYRYVRPETFVFTTGMAGWEPIAHQPELGGTRPEGAAPRAAKAQPGAARHQPPQQGGSVSGSGGGDAADDDEDPPSLVSTERASRVGFEDAPEADDAWDAEQGLRVVDELRRVRATIAADGEVRDFRGKLLGYIEPHNGDVGSAEMEYLGSAHESGQVCDRHDMPCGEFDQGRGFVKSIMGSVLAEVSIEGTVRGNAGQTAGYFEGFRYKRMNLVAAYVLILDKPFVIGY